MRVLLGIRCGAVEKERSAAEAPVLIWSHSHAGLRRRATPNGSWDKPSVQPLPSTHGLRLTLGFVSMGGLRPAFLTHIYRLFIQLHKVVCHEHSICLDRKRRNLQKKE
jgi:hypothetical protein